MGAIKQFFRRANNFISFLVQTSGFVSGILSTLAFFGITSVYFGWTNNLLWLTAIGSGVVLLAGLLAIAFFSLITERSNARKAKYNDVNERVVYPAPQAEEDYTLDLKEIIYEYFPDGQTIRQRKRFRVKARRNGLRTFTDRYKWTGVGKCELHSLTPGYIITNERKEEFWNYYDVAFPMAVASGKAADFVVEWNLYDEERKAVPFLSTMIDLDTEILVMEVILPPNLEPKEVFCLEYESYLDADPVRSQEVRWNPATNSIKFVVERPKLHRKYLIYWKYKDAAHIP